ncbi:NUDIX domain-containing protein [Rhodococcus hoagii]|nr:NUDIX domain-containing protein [Prescottella equi]
MHDRPAPKVGVGIVVERPDGRILLGCRVKPTEPTTWCLPGGHLEPGETIEEAARRECREESGSPTPRMPRCSWPSWTPARRAEVSCSACTRAAAVYSRNRVSRISFRSGSGPTRLTCHTRCFPRAMHCCVRGSGRSPSRRGRSSASWRVTSQTVRFCL